MEKKITMKFWEEYLDFIFHIWIRKFGLSASFLTSTYESKFRIMYINSLALHYYTI